MRLKLLKISILSILSVLVILAGALGVFFWLLSRGPVPLSFLNGRIEAAVNAELHDMKVTLGDAVLELDPKGNIPQVRFRNLLLKDTEGNIIASAPRAAVSLNTAALFKGDIVADSLELIGPKISARRNLDGTVTLGVGGQAAEADQPVVIDENFDVQSEKESITGPATAPEGTTTGAKLIALLDSRDGSNSVSALQKIRITQASLNVFDDANAANWYAPSADLTFQKMPYGFVVLAKADVATKADPWHVEFSATYQHETRNFSVSATIDNLVPANVADKIFALSQFAKVKIPLSGHVEMDVKEDGKVGKAFAELAAAAGQLNLPDYLAQPIVVDDGNFRVNYKPETQSFEIVDSSILVGGSRAEISGVVSPLRTTEGKLDAVDILLRAKNVNLDTEGIAKDPVFVDRIEFSGRAAIEQARLDINDLVVMSGNSGVRMRGIITGGEKSPGIQMAGRVRDVNINLLKKIWPPIIAPKSRTWISEHVVEGKVPEGTFQVNLPADALAEAQQNRRLPDNAVDFSFKLADVKTHYFKDMPVIENATGIAAQKGNDFDLTVSSGQTTLDSGRLVKIESGSFAAHNIMAEVVQGVFAFKLAAPVDAMLDLASQPDLNLIKTDTTQFPKITGVAKVGVDLQFPLIKDVPKEQLQFATKININNAGIAQILPGIDLTEGELAVDVSKNAIAVSGPAKINGLAAKVDWKKPRDGGEATSQFSATLDEKTREKLGLKLTDYLSGPTPVVAKLDKNDAGQSVARIAVDLSQAKMKLKPLGWKREPQEGTTASFVAIKAQDGSTNIDEFKLDGPGLRLRGKLAIGANSKMKFVTMDEIRLDEDNVFSASIVPGEGTLDLRIKGTNFDARPYIKTLISPVQANDGAAQAPSQNPENQDFTLNAQFKHVTAYRGEAVDNVTAILRVRGGKIADADISGNFLSGQPVKIKVTPLATGRDMKVFTSDGGAAVRAANFYSKIAGGELQFSALIGNEEGSPLHNGQLQIKNFEVRNEAALAELDQRGKPKKSGPRKDGITFKKLWLPFSIDQKFVRFGDVTLQGIDMCATASGGIRKSDGGMEITGTVIPVCGLTSAFNDVPLLGAIISGGKNSEGLFGMTYSMSGSLTKPNVRVNALSMLAPGPFRRLFDFHNGLKNSN